MTMVPSLRKRARHKNGISARAAGIVAVAIAAALLAGLGFGATAPVLAQAATEHYRYAGDLPPGAIGRQQLERGGPLPGYFQPVEIQVPAGAMISLAEHGGFQEPQPGPANVGLLIGQVYRFRVTGIPLQEGMEVYPTIEVIDRLYPPPGQKARFPIPVQLTADELSYALEGKLVTRVIYLENPRAALAHAQDKELQRYFEVGPQEDPLYVADRLGRPMAILRMGSRLPDPSEMDEAFFFGSPPLVRYDASATQLRSPPLPIPLKPSQPLLPPPAAEEIVPPAGAMPPAGAQGAAGKRPSWDLFRAIRRPAALAPRTAQTQEPAVR